MTDQPGGYDAYVAALRELDSVRAAHDAAVAARHGRAGGLHATMDTLWHRLATQQARLHRLAADCGLPAPRAVDPAAPPSGTPLAGDPAQYVTAAAGDVDAADRGYVDARYLAHRPKLFPRWRADERNGLIYGGYALLGLLVQFLVVVSWAGTEHFTDLFAPAAICLVIPFVALAAGWLTIGVVSRPLLGDESQYPGGKLPRNPRLGMVICLSTWIVSCGLGQVYLNF